MRKECTIKPWDQTSSHLPRGGEVSTSRGLFCPADDAPWHPFTGGLVQGAEAAVLPVRFEGQNSRLFHLASRASPTLRLSLLLREAVRRMGSEIVVRVGEAMPFEELRAFADPKGLVDHLRRVTYAL
jgi:putative hemolysin